ncbi:hypothetical protein GCK72_008123 [Caenorhabditis remanei]|uniref:Uncharacterized protein n=1 Tax=Caenorhabditis remanei TaxID=31234 RepID=A0A6A5HLZ0_CAERE|nr:hypothetical protein GCK72_008123 [Caenorhabditis remanei]KAF1768161.1 hypothetical protein GCK72_008123 [Caenorhabditis remanei]
MPPVHLLVLGLVLFQCINNVTSAPLPSSLPSIIDSLDDFETMLGYHSLPQNFTEPTNIVVAGRRADFNEPGRYNVADGANGTVKLIAQ